MKIRKNWTIKDEVSNLKIKVVEGDTLNRLHIENFEGTMNRDFFFTNDGTFNGTGTNIRELRKQTNG